MSPTNNFIMRQIELYHKYIVCWRYTMGLYGQPLSIRALLRLADDDRLIAHRRYTTITVDVFRPASQALNPTASGSLATVALSRAATDPKISEALSLVGHDALTWGRIYDIRCR
jgi:hypothetical protein